MARILANLPCAPSLSGIDGSLQHIPRFPALLGQAQYAGTEQQITPPIGFHSLCHEQTQRPAILAEIFVFQHMSLGTIERLSAGGFFRCPVQLLRFPPKSSFSIVFPNDFACSNFTPL